MSSPPHVLISGAGIAGPALAYWLNADGWRTTVVERAGQRRDEGQNIDIRGAAREVARRMDIEDALRGPHRRARAVLKFLSDVRGLAELERHGQVMMIHACVTWGPHMRSSSGCG